ncbi:DUF58 domain-containing protein [Alkalibacillus aidingensis]|uniref:DUF58 domain-containing protein n=1 Tax=Alkalibacillus aidingensis TaxID=2747607 RepID=UPI001660E796|nr:DUF58 domain-containing protein [Alkalibacillus aidingensis]
MLKSFFSIFRLIFVIVLLAALFAYGMFQGGFVSWFLFFSFLPVLMYSLMMILYPMKWVRIERHIAKRYLKAGQTLTVTLKVKRHLPIPVFYMIIEDQLPTLLSWKDTRHLKYQFLSKPSKLLNREGNKTIVFPWLKREITYQYELPSVPRGRHEFNQVKLATGDFLGLVRKEQEFNVETIIFVEPGEISLQLDHERSTFEEGQQTAYSIKANHTNLVAGIRDYEPGDQVTRIDWKTTARTQNLVTKEFEEEKHKDLTIILNGMSQDRQQWLAFEACVELTHAIANHSIHDHGNVSVVALGHGREAINLSHGKQSFEQLTRLLGNINLVDDHSFHFQLKKEGWQLSKDRNLVIITHELSSSINQTIFHLSQQNIDIDVFYVKSKHLISTEERNGINQLHHAGINVTWFNEDNLVRRHIEVNA